MDLFLRPRKPSWMFTLLDADDRPIRELREVSGGSGEFVALSRLGGSATLTLTGLGQDFDWMSQRIKATYDPGINGVEPWDMGVWMLSSPVEKYSAAGKAYEVAMLPKTQVVDEDTIPSSYAFPAGANYVQEAVNLLRSTGETRVAVTDSDLTLGSPLVFDPGTPKLTVINELLTAAGYWSLWTDGSGQFRVEPYENPGDRAVSFTFTDEHKKALHSVEWSREQDHSAVPNRYVVVSESEGDKPPLIGVAENNAPNSPYSIDRRGRWITRVEEGVEAGSQRVIDNLAARRLRDAMAPVGRISVSHLMLPISVNDVVSFTDQDYTGAATVQRLSWSFTDDTVMQAEWREV